MQRSKLLVLVASVAMTVVVAVGLNIDSSNAELQQVRAASTTKDQKLPSAQTVLGEPYLGTWRPIVDAHYMNAMRAVYTKQRQPGAPSFDKLAPQLKEAEQATWTFTPTGVVAERSAQRERQRLRVKGEDAAGVTLEVVTEKDGVVEIRLRLADQDTLELTFPLTEEVPGMRMVRVR